MDLVETPFRNRDELFGMLTMLHDAATTRERIQYAAAAGRLEIEFDRVSFDYPKLTKITRRFVFLRHHELPGRYSSTRRVTSFFTLARSPICE